MNELITTPTVMPAAQPNHFCRSCGECISSIDNFCGRCGSACRELTHVVDAAPPQALTPFDQQATAGDPTNGELALSGSGIVATTLNNRWAVMGILAFVGPLGLLALWFSPRFSPTNKTLITAFYILLTVVVPLAIAWYWLEVAVRPVFEGLDGRLGL